MNTDQIGSLVMSVIAVSAVITFIIFLVRWDRRLEEKAKRKRLESKTDGLDPKWAALLSVGCKFFAASARDNGKKHEAVAWKSLENDFKTLAVKKANEGNGEKAASGDEWKPPGWKPGTSDDDEAPPTRRFDVN